MTRNEESLGRHFERLTDRGVKYACLAFVQITGHYANLLNMLAAQPLQTLSYSKHFVAVTRVNCAPALLFCTAGSVLPSGLASVGEKIPPS